MTIRIAINGFGRIGRNILRAHFESQKNKDLEIVAINDLAPLDINAHLLRYDTTHGKFPGEVKVDNDALIVNGQHITMTSERDPSKLPWKQLKIDVVFECTGFFTERSQAEKHIEAGAKKVIISAPGQNVDATIVYGVNHEILTASDTIISNASCTTNCLAPLVKPLHDKIGIESGLMVTVHAFTNDQALIDTYHKDLHRARAASENIIPTKTGAASAVGLVIPELKGKLDGYALRVPVVNVSAVDLTFIPKRKTSIDEINQILETASKNELRGILEVNREPLVSRDFNHNPASSIADITQTRMVEGLAKVFSWYDNEWGFSNRMLDVANYWLRK